MPNITGHTELVGLMAYPIRHTQSPTTHNLAYDKNGDDVIQLAFEVDNDTLEAAVESIRALKMLGSNISMPNKTVVHKYLDEVDEAAKHDLGDLALLKEKMHEADIFCDATGVGMHPLEDLSNIPDPSYFRKDLIVTDTVYAPRETVMMKQAKEAGCTRVYNGMSMMLFQALIAIELYTGKSTPVDYMKEKLGI